MGENMRYRELGRTGIKISAVSLGGAYLMGPDPEKSVDIAVAVVQRAAELGINYIDTAPLYGHSEVLLGQALAQVKTPFEVATKVGFDPKDFDYRSDSVLASLERSVERLGIERLSVAQIHEVNLAGWDRIMEPGGTLEGLRRAQQRGLCRFIGITGRAIPLLARLAASGEFDTLLCYHDYHPCSSLAAEQVLPAAAKQHMGVVMATVLAGGLFVGGQPQERLLTAMADQERRQTEKTLAALAADTVSLPQAAFAWVLRDERVSSVSSGAANPTQLEEVAAAGDQES
jgi:L-galactose dehydrogenase